MMPQKVVAILVSLQHKNLGDVNPVSISKEFKEKVLDPFIPTLHEKLRILFKDDYELIVNPSGSFTYGGPAADTGITGRKIIVDTLPNQL